MKRCAATSPNFLVGVSGTRQNIHRKRFQGPHQKIRDEQMRRRLLRNPVGRISEPIFLHV
jgi:hypothetical protein